MPNPTPYEINGEDDKYKHLMCDSPNWIVPDAAPGMARVLWAMYSPGLPFPAADTVDYCHDNTEEDLEEEVIEYVDAVNVAVAYGKTQNIAVPLPTGWAELTTKTAIAKARMAKREKLKLED
jgi:hypothetical protein